MREKVESVCQSILRTAADSVDRRGEDVYSAYSWARGKLSGMADAFLITYEFELYYIANHYYNVADKRIYNACFRR